MQKKKKKTFLYWKKYTGDQINCMDNNNLYMLKKHLWGKIFKKIISRINLEYIFWKKIASSLFS